MSAQGVNGLLLLLQGSVACLPQGARGQLPSSAMNCRGLLARSLPFPWQGLVRVYTKKVGHKPDFGDPVVLR